MSTKYKLQSVKLVNPVSGKEGADFGQMVSEISIVESIDFPAIRCTVTVEDAISTYTKLTGNELLQIEYTLPDLGQKKSYIFKVYRVGPIVKLHQKARYNIECISQECMINELSYIFGSYKNKKVSEIIKEILTSGPQSGDKSTKQTSKGINILSRNKKLEIEDTKDKFQCVIPGMRAFDAVNWLGSKAVRNNPSSGASFQSGFIFYENFDGFYFKSFDKIVEDCKNFKEYTDRNGNKIKSWYYKYQPKKSSDDSTVKDYGIIESIQYPDVFNLTEPVRNGSYAGLFTSLALDVIPNSQFNKPKGNKQAPYSGIYFSLTSGTAGDFANLYAKQSHLGSISPYENNKEDYTFRATRRNRMKADMIHAFDDPNEKTPTLESGSNPVRAKEVSVYTHARKTTFSSIKLSIRIAGNAAMHVGNPITVEIPRQIPDEGKIELDTIYSGLYVIAGVRQQLNGNVMFSDLVLVKDSLGSSIPK
jgi:hypothetical protein